MAIVMHVNGDAALCCKPGAWEIYERGDVVLAPPMHRFVIEVAFGAGIDPHALDEQIAMLGLEPEALAVEGTRTALIAAVRG